MPVPVVNIGIMWVDVRQFLVPVRVRFTRGIAASMNALRMLVVRVAMGMPQRFMAMLMRVPLGQVPPNSGGHNRRVATLPRSCADAPDKICGGKFLFPFSHGAFRVFLAEGFSGLTTTEI